MEGGEESQTWLSASCGCGPGAEMTALARWWPVERRESLVEAVGSWSRGEGMAEKYTKGNTDEINKSKDVPSDKAQNEESKTKDEKGKKIEQVGPLSL